MYGLSVTMSLLFAKLGLSTPLLSSLSQRGFSTPTEVQQRAIPSILKGNDVIAGAQTGTGKTAAYTLPILERWLSQNMAKICNKEDIQPPTFALVLVPTRELAEQVGESIKCFISDLPISVVTVYGGKSIKLETQALKAGVDILIATPGRLLDHLYCRHIALKDLSVLVFDEADRMLDMGFLPSIERILKQISPKKSIGSEIGSVAGKVNVRQTLFFSATFNQDVKNFAYQLMSSPIEIYTHQENSVANQVIQIVHPVNKSKKAALLSYLIGVNNWQQVLIFTKTKQGAEALVQHLKLDGIYANSMHGDKSQGARLAALNQFKEKKIRALVATDVAARGLDIFGLDQVINFDMPFKAEDYVHRIGRTGRAGKDGLAVSLMTTDEEWMLKDIESLIDDRILQQWVEGFEPQFEEEEITRTTRRGSDKRRLKQQLMSGAKNGKNNQHRRR